MVWKTSANYRYSILTLLFAAVFGFSFATKSFAQNEMRDLRKTVATYERIFEALEADYKSSVQTELDAIDKNADPSKVEVSSTSTAKGLWSGQKYYAHNSRLAKMGDGTEETLVQIQAYDGTQTLINHYGDLGNIVKEKVAEYTVKPNYFGIPRLGTSANLTKILDFTPNTGPYLCQLRRWQKVEYDYQGIEKKHGVPCHTIKILVFYDSEDDKPNQKHRLWISTVHNHTVLASESYSIRITEKVPFRKSGVREWREIEKSIFIPQLATTEEYEVFQDGTSKLYSTRTFELQECSLKCDPSDSRFSNVAMPDGKSVYVVENGKIVETLVDGKPVAESADLSGINATSTQSILGNGQFWPVFIVGNLLFLSLIVGAVYLRRKRHVLS